MANFVNLGQIKTRCSIYCNVHNYSKIGQYQRQKLNECFYKTILLIAIKLVFFKVTTKTL